MSTKSDQVEWRRSKVVDKEATSYNDIFDAFRLALEFYHFEEQDWQK